MTRAQVADLCGSPAQAAHLRATVARMGKDPEWYDTTTASSTSLEWYQGLPPEPPAPPVEDDAPARKRRRAWPYVAVVAALSVTADGVWQATSAEEARQERSDKGAAYKGRSGAELHIDGVSTDLVAHWNSDRDKVVIELRSYFDKNAQHLRLDADGESASSKRQDGWHPKAPEIALPVSDPLADDEAVSGAGVTVMGWYTPLRSTVLRTALLILRGPCGGTVVGDRFLVGGRGAGAWRTRVLSLRVVRCLQCRERHSAGLRCGGCSLCGPGKPDSRSCAFGCGCARGIGAHGVALTGHRSER